MHVSFLLTPASKVAGRVVGCRSKVTGQDVAVTPFPLLMCSSVTLATTLCEVVLLPLSSLSVNLPTSFSVSVQTLCLSGLAASEQAQFTTL